ncbi:MULTISPECIES: WXG100 family type VII secretion target [Streptomyces]|uniref:WXG100 family type VII secretion target n=1 Tax=Streptomyces kaempferi TaxID=333725 RepID=A0ABW3X8X7_9ACTN|nr:MULTISPECIES: WXG100 family type VII secretion target [unclassified Streptomyces]QIY64926.1 WXG100 family type VII secretion target [Streptomyces sp. RPA4-2]
MADGRKFDDDRVQKLQTNVLDRYESIKKQLAALQGTIDMIEASWTGVGANAFNKKQTEINDNMAQIGRMLDRFLENLHLTKSDKIKLEDELHSTITNIQVDLGGKTSALNSY